jgi:hypothetical protein
MTYTVVALFSLICFLFGYLKNKVCRDFSTQFTNRGLLFSLIVIERVFTLQFRVRLECP